MSLPLRRLLSSPFRRPFHWIGLLLILTGLGLGAWQFNRYAKVRSHRREAEEALAHYDFDSARQHLAILLQLRPRDAGVRLLAAHTARRARVVGEAKHHLRGYRDCRRRPTP